jgi:hypothetical protein
MQHVLDGKLAPGACKSPMVSKVHSDDGFFLVFFPLLPRDRNLPAFPPLACLLSALFCPNPNASSNPQYNPPPTEPSATPSLPSFRATYQKCQQRAA